MSNLEMRLINLLKTDGGKSSTYYAALTGVNISEIQKALERLKYIGKAYSMPKSKNNGYSWHLNAKDMGSVKFMLTSQKWDRNIVFKGI